MDAGKRSAGGFDRVRGCEIGKKDIQLQHVIFPLRDAAADVQPAQ